MPAYLWFSANHVTNIDQDCKVLLQQITVSVSYFIVCAVNLLNDILCEYNVHTAGQLENRVYDVFTAAEQ